MLVKLLLQSDGHGQKSDVFRNGSEELCVVGIDREVESLFSMCM